MASIPPKKAIELGRFRLLSKVTWTSDSRYNTNTTKEMRQFRRERAITIFFRRTNAYRKTSDTPLLFVWKPTTDESSLITRTETHRKKFVSSYHILRGFPTLLKSNLPVRSHRIPKRKIFIHTNTITMHSSRLRLTIRMRYKLCGIRCVDKTRQTKWRQMSRFVYVSRHSYWGYCIQQRGTSYYY